MNDKIIIEPAEDIPCEDSTETLLERYEHRKMQKTDDVFAMQALLCVLTAGMFILLNLLNPELCAEIYEKINSLVSDESEIIPNLIDAVSGK